MENSKGEYGISQHELNVRYCEVLEMADRHTVYKQVRREASHPPPSYIWQTRC